MSVKTLLQFFTPTVLIMSALSQCFGRNGIMRAGLPGAFCRPWPYEAVTPFNMPYGPAFSSIGSGLGPNPVCGFKPAATYGGRLAVTSSSPIVPIGLTVESENIIEGVVAMSGQLPFLGAVAADGIFPSVGAGVITYGCGDELVAILAEAPIASAAINPGYGYGGILTGGIPYNRFSLPVGCGLIYY